MRQKTFVVGCGYVGSELTKTIQQESPNITALVKTESSAQTLQAAGINTKCVDLDVAIQLDEQDFQQACTFYLLPPPAYGKQDERLRKFLDALGSRVKPSKFILLSTSGVYGDCAGAWVDETSAPNPQSDRGHRRLHAEQQATLWCEQHRVPLIILRVPGIYGPERLPLMRLESREPVLRENESPWSNRIHRDDLVACLIASAQAETPDGIYNVSDGNPSTMTHWFKAVARLAKIALPPEISLQEAESSLSAGMLSYLRESKRLNVEKMQRVLQVNPQYKNIEDGISASLANAS